MTERPMITMYMMATSMYASTSASDNHPNKVPGKPRSIADKWGNRLVWQLPGAGKGYGAIPIDDGYLQAAKVDRVSPGPRPKRE